MRYRALGHTGLLVSEIGFGAWGIGGDAGGAVAYGPADSQVSIQALRAALDRGINFYDTSDFYGHGRSEELIGEAFAGRRNEVVIASKAGMLADGSPSDYAAALLRQSLEASLKRLRTDYLDLFYLHSPPLEAVTEDAIAELEKLRDAGTIRAFGLSARSPAEAKSGIDRFGFACVQVNFNLIDQRAVECGLFAEAATKGTGVVARTPLSFGFLTGAYSASEDFHEHDHRRSWSPEQRRVWAEAPAHFAALVSKISGQTAAQFALRFCLAHSCVSSTIPGMLTTQHVAENAGASDLPPLSPVDQARAAEICSRTNFFVRR